MKGLKMRLKNIKNKVLSGKKNKIILKKKQSNFN